MTHFFVYLCNRTNLVTPESWKDFYWRALLFNRPFLSGLTTARCPFRRDALVWPRLRKVSQVSDWMSPRRVSRECAYLVYIMLARTQAVGLNTKVNVVC
jgi:hypothetical protein